MFIGESHRQTESFKLLFNSSSSIHIHTFVNNEEQEEEE